MLAAFFVASDWGLPLRIEGGMLDLRFRLRPVQRHSVPVVIVEIDDPSIAEIGRWPWSRRIFARLLDRIADAKPGLVCLDLLFTEPQSSLLADETGPIEAAMAPLLQTLDPTDK